MAARGPDTERLAVWRDFLATHATVLRRLEEELAEQEGLDLRFYDVLVQLAEADGQKLRIQQLADAVLLSKSGVSRLITRMEEAGYVTRSKVPDDRRGTLACLTDDGLATLRRCSTTHLDGVAEHFTSHLDDAEVEAMASAFGKIRRSLGD